MTENITRIGIVDGIGCIEQGAHGTAIDLDATLAAYQDEMIAALHAEYPGALVTYRWENSERGFGIEALDGDYDFDQDANIVAHMQGIAEAVYERGDFWVVADGSAR